MSNLKSSEADLIMYLKSVSGERGIPYEEVIKIFSDALAQSLRRALDLRDAEFRVEIDGKTGKKRGFRRWRVLAEDETMHNEQQEIMLADARAKAGEAGEAGDDVISAGDYIEEEIENMDFDQRISMLSAKQFLLSRLRDAERRRLLNDLLSREEDLVNGQVVRLLRDKGDAMIEVLQVECRLPKREMIPRETLKVGDRVQALIKETVTESRGQQIVLTRTNPRFLVRLFQRVVPEIEKGILEIRGAVRSPGSRAKIAVYSSDPRVDPIGTCVGIRGSRVQAVTNELNGERIDIIQWDEDPVKFVLSALAPAEVSKIELDSERHRMDVLVEPDLMAQAIGKNGTNVRLAAELTGWQLNLCTPAEYQEEKETLALKKSEALAETLDLDIELARVLYDEGFETLEHVAYTPPGDLLEIEGISEEMVNDIQQRAKEAVDEKEAVLNEKLQKVDARLISMPGITEELLYDLVAENILKLEDLADLSSDELLELVEIPAQTADELVLGARALLEEEEEGSQGENASASEAAGS